MVYKSFVGSLVLDTFFYAALRKTLELTVGIDVLMVASVRVFFGENRIGKLLFYNSIVCSLVPDTFFYAALRKTLELTMGIDVLMVASLRVGFWRKLY